MQGHDLDCLTDEEAEVVAETLLAQDPYYRSAEVWKAARRVIRLDRRGNRFRPASFALSP